MNHPENFKTFFLFFGHLLALLGLLFTFLFQACQTAKILYYVQVRSLVPTVRLLKNPELEEITFQSYFQTYEAGDLGMTELYQELED